MKSFKLAKTALFLALSAGLAMPALTNAAAQTQKVNGTEHHSFGSKLGCFGDATDVCFENQSSYAASYTVFFPADNPTFVNGTVYPLQSKGEASNQNVYPVVEVQINNDAPIYVHNGQTITLTNGSILFGKKSLKITVK